MADYNRRMTTADEQGEQEKLQAQAIIAATPFEGVESVRIELGDDHTGDPSMWIFFTMNRELKAEHGWIQAFSKYHTRLALKLLHSGLTRFPYIRFKLAA
jgi:hypothetical protein